LRHEKVAQTLEQCRFTGADLPAKDDESLAALHAVNQIGQGLLMLRASVEKTWIGTEVERTLFQAKEGIVHVRTTRTYYCPYSNICPRNFSAKQRSGAFAGLARTDQYVGVAPLHAGH